MTLILSGTDGLSDVDGSAATPAIKGTDANTGIFFPAADTVGVSTGGSERMRVDSSGNVGIGTSSPSYKLDVRSTLAVLDGSSNIGFYANGSTYTQIWQTLQSTNDFIIQTTASKYISFGINSAEKVRIDTSGNLLVGGTGVIYYSKTLSQFDGSSKYGYTANDTSGVANVGFVAFAVNGTTTTGAIGTITRNGSSNAVLYNTTSDQRLKENIADADAALGVVGAIKVRKYDWKEGGQHENFGFVAQELAQVVNNVVSKGRTEEDMWSLDYGKLTPLLVKAIQEQQALITALTARIEALESK